MELDDFSDISLVYHTSKNHFSTWLAARGEFQLASVMRKKSLGEFSSTKEMRKYVVQKIHERRRKVGRGEVILFSPLTFHASPFIFSRIGNGSMGGKGRGLGFINSVINREELENKFPQIRIRVPSTLVLTTDVFDSFMEDSDLLNFALGSDVPNEKIHDAFLRLGQFNSSVVSNLRTFLERIRYPLVVRSSSLFEGFFFL